MYKKTIKYVDYNGVEREEDFYFNLSKAELLELQTGTNGGFAEKIMKSIQKKDVPAIMQIFKALVLTSYGVKSDDGRKFIKNEEVLSDFQQTEAYSNLIIELATDEKAAEEFINNVIPEMTPEQKIEAEKRMKELTSK